MPLVACAARAGNANGWNGTQAWRPLRGSGLLLML